MTANDLQETLNRLTSGSPIAPEAKLRLLGHFLSITVLRAFAAECMLKAIAFARGGSFQHDHNLTALYEALVGPTRGLIETTADAPGVASPKRVLKRHRNDFVEWRYATGREQTTGLLDLDSVLGVLDPVYRQIRNGKAPRSRLRPGSAIKHPDPANNRVVRSSDNRCAVRGGPKSAFKTVEGNIARERRLAAVNSSRHWCFTLT